MKTLSSIAVSRKRAFGLIETLIAVAVLALVLGVSVMLGTVMLRNTALTAQTVQATNLAREQLETVRNIRDTIWINPDFSSCSPSPSQWDCLVGTNTSARSISLDNEISSGSRTYRLKQDDKGYFLVDDPNNPNIVRLAYADMQPIAFTLTVIVSQISSSSISSFSLGDGSTANLNEQASGSNGHGKKIYRIDSKVDWNDSYGRTNSVTLTTYLSDWLPRF